MIREDQKQLVFIWNRWQYTSSFAPFQLSYPLSSLDQMDMQQNIVLIYNIRLNQEGVVSKLEVLKTHMLLSVGYK